MHMSDEKMRLKAYAASRATPLLRQKKTSALNFTISLALSFLTGALSCAFGLNNSTAVALLTLSLIPAYYLMLLSCEIEGQTALTLFASMYIIFSLVTPGIIHTATNNYPFYRMSYAESDINGAASIILLFNTLLLLGFLFFRSTRKPPEPSTSHFTVESKGILFGSILTAIAFAGFLGVGPSKFLTVRRDIGADLAQFSTLFAMNFVRFMSFVSFSLLFAAAASRKSWSKAAIVPAIISSVVFFLANSPLSIARFVLFAYIIGFCVIFLGMWKRNYKVITAFAYPLLLTTIFPLMSTLSRGRQGQSLFIHPLDYYISSGDFDGFQSTINVFRWIESSGTQNGRQMISALLVFIPREFWSDKAVSTGALAAKANGYLFTNISCPLPAEFFSDFGWIGVILGGLLIGYLLAAANAWATRAQATGKLSNLMTYGLMAGYSTILLRGSLIAVIAACALAMLVPQILRLIENKR